jgi:hypothetical protein
VNSQYLQIVEPHGVSDDSWGPAQVWKSMAPAGIHNQIMDIDPLIWQYHTVHLSQGSRRLMPVNRESANLWVFDNTLSLR